MQLLAWIAVALVMGCLVGDAAACPMCKELLFDPVQAKQVMQTAKGYALSIGVWIGTPLLIVGTVTALVVRSQRRSKQIGA